MASPSATTDTTSQLPEPQPIPTYVHGLAGSGASVAALALLYPLDQLRTLQQLGTLPTKASPASHRKCGIAFGQLLDAFEQEGTAGMYRGLTPSLVTLSVSNFIFFFAYQAMRAALAKVSVREVCSHASSDC